MQTFVDRSSHPHRAAEARQFSLDATHPRVRTIQREIAQRYEQLAAIPNDAPVGAFSLRGSPSDAVAPALSRCAARWHEDRTVGPASPGGCDWEDEGGAPRDAAPARDVTVTPNPPMFAALNDVELKRDLPTAGANICASPPDEERPADGKPHMPPVTSSAASLGTAADHHINRHTGVAGIAIRIDPADVDLEREVSVDRAGPMAPTEALEVAMIRAAPQLVWRY